MTASNATVATIETAETPCVFLIENKADFHYEILESVALRYPLPWDELGDECSSGRKTTKISHNVTGVITEDSNELRASDVIRVDFALSIQKRAGMEGEQEGWIRYFQRQLQGHVRVRPTDGRRVVFGNIVDYTNYTTQYHAIIAASLDAVGNFRPWMKSSTRLYGVMHTACRNCDPSIQQRMCWITPIYKDACFFLPLDFPATIPLIQNNDGNHDSDSSTVESRWQKRMLQVGNTFLDSDDDLQVVNICTSGKSRDHSLLGKALEDVLSSVADDVGTTTVYQSWKSLNVVIFHRPDTTYRKHLQPSLDSIYPPSSRLNVTVIHESEYATFHRLLVTQCDIYLPLIDPVTHPDYFDLSPQSEKKLSGSMALVLSHNIPTSVPKSVYDLYGPYMSKSLYTVYKDPYIDPTNTTVVGNQNSVRNVTNTSSVAVVESLGQALSQLMNAILTASKTEREQPGSASNKNAGNGVVVGGQGERPEALPGPRQEDVKPWSFPTTRRYKTTAKRGKKK